MRVLVSLHDVSPAHQARLERAEALFASLGVSRVAYFIIPDYHRSAPIATNREFQAWCARPRPHEVEWVLHGFFHVDDTAADAAGAGPVVWAKRRTMTGGEGEFLGLDAHEQRRRLSDGRAAARAIGLEPASFVAPAWLFNRELLPALAETGFAYTEDHVRVIEVATGETRRCPAITWATRTTVRRVGSRLVCPALFYLLRNEPAIRVAVHPFDFDHPQTVRQITWLLRRAMERRTCSSYADLYQRPARAAKLMVS